MGNYRIKFLSVTDSRRIAGLHPHLQSLTVLILHTFELIFVLKEILSWKLGSEKIDFPKKVLCMEIRNFRF